jgi:hypothetical protein
VADFVFDIARGRTGEFYYRIDNNDPANSAFVFGVLATSGLESDHVLRAKTDFLALVSGTTNWVMNTGYARLTRADADLAAFSPDTTNHRLRLDMADLTWGAITAGDGWSKIVMGYDSDTTAGTDSSIIPVLAWDFVWTPDGSAPTAQLNANGFYESSV